MPSLLAALSKHRLAPLFLVLAGVMLAVAAYLQALNFPFVSDDSIFITENRKLAVLPWTQLWRVFTEPYNSVFEFLPLRDLTFWLDMAISGQSNPSVPRLDNIVLYLLCVPLVYSTTSSLWKYFRPADAASACWIAATVTAMYAIHPALVESVVWITGRKYVLPNLFSMLTLWLALKVRREHGFSAAHAAAALLAFVALMLSKSSYVGVAPMVVMLWTLFWLDIPAGQRRFSTLLWPCAILLLAVLLLLNFIFHNKGFDTVPAYFGIEAVTRSLAALGWLARLAATPESRHFLYPVFEDAHFYVMVALGAAVLAAACIGTVAVLKKRSLTGFILAAFFLLCLPYLQLIPAKPPSLVSDRYVALSAWLMALLIVSMAWRLRPALRVIVLLAVALPWAYQTIERPKDWISMESLIGADVAAFPGHYWPLHIKVFRIDLNSGSAQRAAESASRITDPEVRNLTSELIRSDYFVYSYAYSTGDTRDAITSLNTLGRMLDNPPVAIKWNPSLAYIWTTSENKVNKQWDYLINHFPDDASVRYNAGLWMSRSHRYADAIALLQAAIASGRLPEDARGGAYCSLAETYRRAGQREDAARIAGECPSRE